MTTPTDDAPDSPVGGNETASPDSPPKVRRFAPRRSRSTAAAASDATPELTAAAGDAVPPLVASGDTASASDTTTFQAGTGDAVSAIPDATDAPQPQQYDGAPVAPGASDAPEPRLYYTAPAAPDTFAAPLPHDAVDPSETATSPATLGDAHFAADELDNQATIVSTLSVDPPADPLPGGSPRPSRRARSRRAPRPATVTADTETPAVADQPLATAEAAPRAATAEPAALTVPAGPAIAESVVPDKPKRNRSRSRPRAQEAQPEAAVLPAIVEAIGPAAEPTEDAAAIQPGRSRRNRNRRTTTIGTVLDPAATVTVQEPPAKPVQPPRSRNRRTTATNTAQEPAATAIGATPIVAGTALSATQEPQVAAPGTQLEPDALSMLGTIPAAALAEPEAPGLLAHAPGDIPAERWPEHPEAPALDESSAPMLTAPIPEYADLPQEGQAEATAPDDSGPATSAAGEVPLPASTPDVAANGSHVAGQTAPPVLPPAADRWAEGEGLFSPAEAARAADRYEAAARRTEAGGNVGDAILAQALRELFPLLPDLSDDTPTAEEDAPRTGAIEDEQDDAEQPELDAATDEDADDDSSLEDDDQADLLSSDLQDGDANRRRGRRGRRGGRGRRRTGASVQPLDADGREQRDDADEGPAAAAPSVAAPESEPDAFTPQQPPRQERPWREGGPRRPWGRTYRDAPSSGMPAPKPANGIRPNPIPQAAPPLAAIVAPPEIVPPIVPAFAMPNLRLNEPLAPGETRTERLLEAQTILLRTMIQQQARQIDVLTAAVDGLRQSVQGLVAGGARGYMPRTAIFVDAPNVVYAADNARVQLDYGRMLKYFSKDRHLVHALSYSPIIDDVREGIRYETQRFVAPFLRTGWKLITKPLKRFSDGSAKGNFDIELAVDIVTMSERLDIVVLVSGDSDFERLIQLIQSKGVRVEVVAFASNVSTELVNIADVFIDIGQHLEHLRAL